MGPDKELMVKGAISDDTGVYQCVVNGNTTINKTLTGHLKNNL